MLDGNSVFGGVKVHNLFCSLPGGGVAGHLMIEKPTGEERRTLDKKNGRRRSCCQRIHGLCARLWSFG